VRRFRSASSSFVAYAVASRASFAADEDEDEDEDDVTDRLDAPPRVASRTARATARILDVKVPRLNLSILAS